MSLVTSIWTWVLIVVFGGTPMMDSSNPPPPDYDEPTEESESPAASPVTTLAGELDRIYVGF